MSDVSELDIERLLLRWRFDDLQEKKGLEIAKMIESLLSQTVVEVLEGLADKQRTAEYDEFPKDGFVHSVVPLEEIYKVKAVWQKRGKNNG